MRIGFAPALALIVAGTRPAVADGPAELQRRWMLVSVEAGGRTQVLKEVRPVWEVVGDSIRYGGEELAVLTAEPEAMPRSIDLRFVGPMRVYEGIYAVEGDLLKVCLNKRTEGEKERPDAFSTKGKDDWRLLVFRRLGAQEGDTDGRGFVGMALRADKEKEEVIVDQALEGTPAAKAGLKKGDVILEIGGERVTEILPAVEAVRRRKPGDTLALQVRRDGKEEEVKVRVAVLPFEFIAGLG